MTQHPKRNCPHCDVWHSAEYACHEVALVDKIISELIDEEHIAESFCGMIKWLLALVSRP